MRLLSCLIAPSGGSARVAGFDIQREPLKVREAVGVLTENPGIYDRLTALENMEFFAEAYGLRNKIERDARIRELFEFFDLWDRRDDKAGTFSKGMRQKLAIAKAVVHRPEVLFLDEPSSGLDPKAAKDIRDLMERDEPAGEAHDSPLHTQPRGGGEALQQSHDNKERRIHSRRGASRTSAESSEAHPDSRCRLQRWTTDC